MSDKNNLRENVAEAAEAEEGIPVLNEDDPRPLVVTFSKRKDAEEAVRLINKALRKRPGSIYQGAIVSRDEDDELTIQDLHDTGLGDIVRGGFNLVIDTGRGGLKLVWSTVGAWLFFLGGGWRLVRGTVRSGLALLGTTITLPRRRKLDTFGAGGHIEPTGVELDPGDSAVVIIADHEIVEQLAPELEQSGGERVV